MSFRNSNFKKKSSGSEFDVHRYENTELKTAASSIDRNTLINYLYQYYSVLIIYVIIFFQAKTNKTTITTIVVVEVVLVVVVVVVVVLLLLNIYWSMASTTAEILIYL